MGINLTNFLSSQSKNTKMIDFQDLDHIDGLSISVLSANLYKNDRDDLAMFYFRDGANHASLYTQSKIISENKKDVLRALKIGLKKNLIKRLELDGNGIDQIISTVKKISKLKKMPNLLNCDIVVIENQPVLKNPTMKSIQMVLYSYFLIYGYTVHDSPIKNIALFN